MLNFVSYQMILIPKGYEHEFASTLMAGLAIVKQIYRIPGWTYETF